MIPLRALLARRSFPSATILLIVLNVLCFVFQLSMPTWMQHRFELQYALVPDHLRLSSLVTSMFLHGGWLHLIGNMWFLWIYGSHVEDVIGPLKFLVFYLLSGIAAAAIHFAFNLGSPIPTIGASGAIAGVMGAFMILFPRARIVTLIFIVFFVTTVDIPAAFLLLYWFAIQLISGLSSTGPMYVTQAQNTAWFAHIGGFLAGLVLLKLFEKRRPRYSY